MTSFTINEPFKRTPANELSYLVSSRGVIFRVQLAIAPPFNVYELFEIVLLEIYSLFEVFEDVDVNILFSCIDGN